MDAQSLEFFNQFVDFIKNPDKIKDLVTQVQSATASHAVALGKLTQGQSLADYEAKLVALETRIQLERQEWDKSHAAQVDALNQRSKALDAREQDLDVTKSSLLLFQEQLNAQLTIQNTTASALAKKESDLNAQIDSVNSQAQDLAQRLALVKQAAA